MREARAAKHPNQLPSSPRSVLWCQPIIRQRSAACAEGSRGTRKAMARQSAAKGTSDVLASVGNAAEHLLANRSRHRTEGNVQSDVEALLRAMDVGTIESQYQTGEGPADVYLPNRRCFIECKSYPAAKDPDKPQARKESESPREQLDRYVHAQIASEIRMLPVFESEAQVAVPWTGIVTDGTHWHVYRYAHELDATGEPESSETFVNEKRYACGLRLRGAGSGHGGKGVDSRGAR